MSYSIKKTRKGVDYLAIYSLSTRFFTKTILSLFLIVVILGVVITLWARDSKAYRMPGPLSDSHAVLTEGCSWCHAGFSPISEKACLKCHTVSGHYQTNPVKNTLPSCNVCHDEHKGKVALTHVPSQPCVVCHGNLKLKHSNGLMAGSIHGFSKDHPEFSVNLPEQWKKPALRVRLDAKEGLEDRTRQKMNHKMHLDPDLTGLDEKGPLTCTFCHTPSTDGVKMQQVRFDPACIKCHLMDFDAKMPDKVVPHGKQPKELDGFLRALYKVSVNEMTEKAEDTLFGKTRRKNTQGKCLQCHYFDLSGETTGSEPNRLPPIAKVSVPAKWFPNAIFKHDTHTPLKCIACHTSATTSEKASDVMIPGISLCRQCHQSSASAVSAAPAECRVCHLYHDKTILREFNGPYTIDEMKTHRMVSVATGKPAPAK